MECSEELWVMRITLIRSRARAANSRFEKPGMPTMPLPSRLSSVRLPMLEMPCTTAGVRGGLTSTSVP